MNPYEQLKHLVLSAEQDASAFYNKGNKSAGTRLRKTMSEVKAQAQATRENVSQIKNQN
ncbi:hypothetical protein GCM10027578_21870 [Spirosoma luteolum]